MCLIIQQTVFTLVFLQNEPGPGHYTGVMATPNGRPQTAYNPNVSFGFTSERFNRQSQQNFSGTAVS